MAFGGGSGAFQFRGYDSVARVSRQAEFARKYMKEMKGVFIKWCSAERGGLLSRKLATHMAEYVRESLVRQTYMKNVPPLKKSWIAMQKAMGVPDKNISKIGMAMTETLLNSIDSFSSGRGGYAVGIRQGATMPTTVQSKTGKTIRYGGFTKVQEVAEALEFGTGGKRQQPARYWFSSAVTAFIEKEFPNEVKRTFLADMKRVRDGLSHIGTWEKELEASDLISEATLGDYGDLDIKGLGEAEIADATITDLLGAGARGESDAADFTQFEAGFETGDFGEGWRPTTMEGSGDDPQEFLVEGVRHRVSGEGEKAIVQYFDEAAQAWKEAKF